MSNILIIFYDYIKIIKNSKFDIFIPEKVEKLVCDKNKLKKQ